jgi:hypothetical protein
VSNPITIGSYVDVRKQTRKGRADSEGGKAFVLHAADDDGGFFDVRSLTAGQSIPYSTSDAWNNCVILRPGNIIWAFIRSTSVHKPPEGYFAEQDFAEQAYQIKISL